MPIADQVRRGTPPRNNENASAPPRLEAFYKSKHCDSYTVSYTFTAPYIYAICFQISTLRQAERQNSHQERSYLLAILLQQQSSLRHLRFRRLYQ